MADAASWYEAQRSGLGTEFLDQVQAAFGRISESPNVYPEVGRSARRALVRRFPFGVFYRVESATVVVFAVMHGSRDPQRWKQRS